MHFLVIFGYLQISFAIKSSGVDQVLTKIFQIDHKLTFNVFHILNRGRISKIEKISDGADPPPKKQTQSDVDLHLNAKKDNSAKDQKNPPCN